jgi:hypothetical protein
MIVITISGSSSLKLKGEAELFPEGEVLVKIFLFSH